MPAMFNVDLTRPELQPSVSPNPVPANSPASVSANATDNLAKPPNTSCDPVDTKTMGTHTVKCTATDLAGNSASATAADL